MAKDRLRTIVENSKGDIVFFGETKMIDKQEEMSYKNRNEKYKSTCEKQAREHSEEHENIDKQLNHFIDLECVLAKTIYDNFVDRGLIENDDQFQQMWFDFYFNDKELDLKNAPKDFVKIFEKIRGMGYEEQ